MNPIAADFPYRQAREPPRAPLGGSSSKRSADELDAIRDRRLADLGDRDRRYIAEHDRDAAAPRGDRPRAAARGPQRAGSGRRHGLALGGEDPREHGDRAQRPARPVGLDERPRHQLHHLGLGHRLHRRGLEALPQLRPPHLHQHPRQGQGPRLRDHADRPAAALESGLPAAADLQPHPRRLLRVGRRPARPRLRGDPQGHQVQGTGPAGAEGHSREG